MKIIISKSKWENMGIKKTSMRDMFVMYVSFADEIRFEDEKDVKFNIKDGKVSPENIWIVTYNNSTFNDQQLIQDMHDRYKNGEYGKVTSLDIPFYHQLFKAAALSATNYFNGTKKDVEGVTDLIEHSCGISAFFDFVKENEKFYESERMEEIKEMELKDDQRPGNYEEYGADKPVPQY